MIALLLLVTFLGTSITVAWRSDKHQAHDAFLAARLGRAALRTTRA